MLPKQRFAGIDHAGSIAPPASDTALQTISEEALREE